LWFWGAGVLGKQWQKIGFKNGREFAEWVTLPSQFLEHVAVHVSWQRLTKVVIYMMQGIYCTMFEKVVSNATYFSRTPFHWNSLLDWFPCVLLVLWVIYELHC
jgi:hypothetical protein